MVTPILLLVLGVGVLVYNQLYATSGKLYLIGTSLDFGWVLLAMGAVQLALNLRHRRGRRRRPKEP